MSIFPLVRPIVVDFETFYDSKNQCSIKADKKGWVGGNWHYTTHKNFYPYLASWFDIEANTAEVVEMDALPAFVKGLAGRTIIAHNAGFDVSVAKYICPGFEPLNTFDTADMASYLQCERSLLGACKYLLGRELNKAPREAMDGRHWRDLTSAEKHTMREYALSDAVNTADLFKYGVDRWPEIEQWMSDFTRKQNWAGLHIDVAYMEQQLDKVGAIRSAALRRIPWSEDHPPMSPKQLAIYCREIGISPPASLAEDSEECQVWEKQYGDKYPVVAAIRDFRKSNTYQRKLELVQRLLRPDGTIPLSTKYGAAPHTLRFSATQFNYQSLPKAVDYCDLRGCIIPSPGNLLIGSDLAGIEARCLPWLAGDADYLSQVEKLDRQAEKTGLSGGGDIYEPAARRMFGYSDPKPLKKADKKLRDATKICVLQLGYQSGASKFLWFTENNVEQETLDRVKQPGEDNAALTKRLVALYRGMNPKITSLWYSLDGELRIACAAGHTFTVQQPNGRRVNYYELGVRSTVKLDGTVRNEVVGKVCLGDESRKLYGGKITENICQEMARHVLVYSIYNLTQAGFKVRCSVHDENVLEVPAEQATPETKARIEAIMSQTPPWAPGLPLAAETTIMTRYTK